MGNGWGVKFWTDSWCGREPLTVSFLGLFAMADCKSAWVIFGVALKKVKVGSLVFTRPFNDWELLEVESYL